MKIRGMLIGLVLVMGIVLFLFYGRMGNDKSAIETQIDQAGRAKIEITGSTLDLLGREVLSASAETGLPRELKDLQRMRPQFSVPLDAWGMQVKYEVLSENSFRLTSAGPDRKFATVDDISREF